MNSPGSTLLLQVTTTVKPPMTNVTVIHQVNMGSKKWHLGEEVLDFDHLTNTRTSGKVPHSMPTHV